MNTRLPYSIVKECFGASNHSILFQVLQSRSRPPKSYELLIKLSFFQGETFLCRFSSLIFLLNFSLSYMSVGFIRSTVWDCIRNQEELWLGLRHQIVFLLRIHTVLCGDFVLPFVLKTGIFFSLIGILACF